jgi:hypothetical protein
MAYPRTIPADDERAVVVQSTIHGGEIDRLEGLLRDEPGLATVRIVDRGGVARTLLHVVADWPGHYPHGARTVAALVAAGADVDARVQHPDSHGSPETPLHWAASSDDVAVLDALLDAGADIEATGAVFTGGAPMSDAVVFGQWRAARRLLERGARTTIWQSAALGLLDRVENAAARDPATTPRDITNAFWHACRGGQHAVAAYLLARGADLNWIGHDRKTPCDVAQEHGDAVLVAWLRARGARCGQEPA